MRARRRRLHLLHQLTVATLPGALLGLVEHTGGMDRFVDQRGTRISESTNSKTQRSDPISVLGSRACRVQTILAQRPSPTELF